MNTTTNYNTTIVRRADRAMYVIATLASIVLIVLGGMAAQSNAAQVSSEVPNIEVGTSVSNSTSGGSLSGPASKENGNSH